jgi:hypothetical protein
MVRESAATFRGTSTAPVAASCLDEGSDTSLYFALWQRSHGMIYDCAVPIEEQGGYSPYVMRCRRFRRIVDVDLGEFYLSFECLGQFIQNRFEASAVSSPRCSEIYQHGPFEIDNFPLEIGVGDIHCSAGVEHPKIEGLLALATFQVIHPPAFQNTILGPTFGAYCND